MLLGKPLMYTTLSNLEQHSSVSYSAVLKQRKPTTAAPPHQASYRPDVFNNDRQGRSYAAYSFAEQHAVGLSADFDAESYGKFAPQQQPIVDSLL